MDLQRSGPTVGVSNSFEPHSCLAPSGDATQISSHEHTCNSKPLPDVYRGMSPTDQDGAQKSACRMSDHAASVVVTALLMVEEVGLMHINCHSFEGEWSDRGV